MKNHPDWLIFFRGVQTTNQCLYFNIMELQLQPLLSVDFAVSFGETLWLFNIVVGRIALEMMKMRGCFGQIAGALLFFPTIDEDDH